MTQKNQPAFMKHFLFASITCSLLLTYQLALEKDKLKTKIRNLNEQLTTIENENNKLKTIQANILKTFETHKSKHKPIISDLQKQIKTLILEPKKEADPINIIISKATTNISNDSNTNIKKEMSCKY